MAINIGQNNFGNTQSNNNVDGKGNKQVAKQGINQSQVMNPKPGDQVTIGQNNSGNAGIQGFNAQSAWQGINQAQVMMAPPKAPITIITGNNPAPPPPPPPPLPPTPPPPTPVPYPTPTPTPVPVPVPTPTPTPTPLPPCPVPEDYYPCVDEHGTVHYNVPMNHNDFGFKTEGDSTYYFKRDNYDYNTNSVPQQHRMTYDQMCEFPEVIAQEGVDYVMG